MAILLGTSGWQYKSWRDALYRGEPQRLWLERYSENFRIVEVNNAFYRLPEQSTFASWAERTPEDFIVGVKMSRYLTHIKRLRDPAEPVRRFLERAEGLGDKLGPVLLQLPPNLSVRSEELGQTLAQFPGAVRVVVEARHESWFCDEVRRVLEKHDAALCWADGPKRDTPTWRTASWGYLRFHQGTSRPQPCYRPSALRQWIEEITAQFEAEEDMYVFFNNDPNVCAVRDAARFGSFAEESGLAVSRHPNPRRIKVTHDPFDGVIG